MRGEIASSLDVVVAGKYREAEDTVVVELASREDRDLPTFTAGAHIDLFLAPGLIRQYSLCGSTAMRNRYRIAVLREPRSRGGSVHIHDRLHTGQVLSIGYPRNHFPLERGAEFSVLLAGGIGVTPILCMADELHRSGAEFRFHYCCRTSARAAFHNAIAASAFAERVRFHFDDGPAAQRINMEEAIGDYRPGGHLYVCGPKGFIEAVLNRAVRSGWPEASLHREYFATPASQGAAVRQAFTIQLKRSGLILHVPPDKSIVQVLQEAGVAIDVSCEQGICGLCMTRVLDGEPDHRDSVLTEEERARNDQLTPCCSRSRTPSLTLDI